MSKEASENLRFLGWQKTPIHQARFGSTTRSGRVSKSAMKNSTGSVQEVSTTWYLLDASVLPIGRIATAAATLLSGKHKPSFTPGADSGDHVVIINADKAYFTSNKAEKKIYYWHTGWMGGLKMRTAGEALASNPEKVLYDAIEGMLPKSRLSKRQLVHLKIYKGADHPHKAQAPAELKCEQIDRFKNFRSGE